MKEKTKEIDKNLSKMMIEIEWDYVVSCRLHNVFSFLALIVIVIVFKFISVAWILAIHL
jgi:hypothetical protein